MKKNQFKAFYLFVTACAAHNVGMTQTALVPEVVVTSSNSFLSKERWAPVDRLSGDALLLRQSSSLGETLSGLAGVSSSYFGSTASRPVIRGLDGDRIRILSNGAASSDVSSLSYDHAIADSELAAESVEIVRGPAALVYGGAAVGGVVNMLDNRIAKEAVFGANGGQLGKVQLGWNTGHGERSGAALIETGTDKYALHVDVFNRKADETRVPIGLACTQGGATRTSNTICNSQADALGGALGGSLLFDHGYLGASLQSTQQHYGSPAEDEVTLKMRSSRFKLEGEGRNLNALGGWIQAVSGHVVQHDYRHEELDAGVVGTTFKTKGREAKLQTKLRSLKLGGDAKSPQLETILGLSNERVDFVADGAEAFVPTTETKTRALYALQELNAPWGKLSAGLRHEAAQVDSLGLASKPSFTPAQRRLAGNSWALGAVLPVGVGLNATANWARSSRIPKDYELYALGDHVATKAYERGDANLEVEKSAHLELGLRWVGERKTNKVSFNVFQTRFDNYIYLQDTGVVNAISGNPEYNYTATPAKLTGWEWAGSKRFVQATQEQPMSLDIEGRISQVKAVQTLTQDALPRIAPQRIGVDFVGKQNAWGWRLGADHNAAQNHIPVGQAAVGGYTLWNAALTLEQKQSGGRMLWFAKLNNATNQLAYPATSILTQTAAGRVPLPGRSLKLGVQLSF
jgi:iron complex outermembrane recepter protein